MFKIYYFNNLFELLFYYIQIVHMKNEGTSSINNIYN